MASFRRRCSPPGDFLDPDSDVSSRSDAGGLPANHDHNVVLDESPTSIVSCSGTCQSTDAARPNLFDEPHRADRSERDEPRHCSRAPHWSHNTHRSHIDHGFNTAHDGRGEFGRGTYQRRRIHDAPRPHCVLGSEYDNRRGDDAHRAVGVQQSSPADSRPAPRRSPSRTVRRSSTFEGVRIFPSRFRT